MLNEHNYIFKNKSVECKPQREELRIKVGEQDETCMYFQNVRTNCNLDCKRQQKRMQ